MQLLGTAIKTLRFTDDQSVTCLSLTYIQTNDAVTENQKTVCCSISLQSRSAYGIRLQIAMERPVRESFYSRVCIVFHRFLSLAKSCASLRELEAYFVLNTYYGADRRDYIYIS